MLTSMPVEVRSYQPPDREAVVAVWRAAGLVRPVNDPYRDIDRKLAVDPAGFLVALDGGKIVGTVMAGYDGHRGWINYMGVDPNNHRQGVGRALIEAALTLLRTRGCPKVNLQVFRANQGAVEFYGSLGFVEDNVMSMGFRLVNDELSKD
jgi:ribosomal protein S18 acetylase RimI-like enzyme